MSDKILIDGAYNSANKNTLGAAIAKGADQIVDASRDALGQLGGDAMKKIFSSGGASSGTE